MNSHLLSRLALVMVAIALALNSCSDERPLNSVSARGAIIHEPWEDQEAELLALLVSGEIAAPRQMYEQIQNDLMRLRKAWGDSIPALRELRHAPLAIPGEVYIDATNQLKAQMESGAYRDWDSINALFGATVEFVHLQHSDWTSVYVRSQWNLNPYRMAEAYERLPGIDGAIPNREFFDLCENVYAHQTPTGLGYLFRDAYQFGSDCVSNKYYYFRATPDTIELVGMRGVEYSDFGAPGWWSEAISGMDLYRHGDAEYRFRDATPPDRTTDLRRVGHQVANYATFEFTAPGDLGLTGNAESYVFRWGPDSVTEANWYLLRGATFTARPVGTRVFSSINTLPATGVYFVGMRSVDKLGNVSPVSNIVTTENILQSGWTYFDSDNSPLPDNEVTALYIDSNNRAWVGTDFGVTVLHAGGGENYGAFDHPIFSQRVTAIEENHKGQILVGSRAGAAIFDGESWTTVWPVGPGTQETEVRCILHRSDDELWLGVGFKGVAQIEEQGWRYHDLTNSGIRGSIVREISSSPDGSLWFGADQGLSQLRDGIWTSLGTTETVTSIFSPDHETILYGTYDGMLHCIIDGIDRTPIDMRPHESWPRQSGAIGEIVQSGDGSIWLSTYGSIRRYDLTSLTELLVLLPSISGLPEREITALAAGADNTLWIGTKNSGVCRWDLTAAGMPELTTTATANR